MTPKEKAKELVDRMFGVQVDNQTFHMYNTLETAKYSALIAVDEMIQQFTNKCCESANVRYWQEVKQEILAL
jgi:hypothetical protein